MTSLQTVGSRLDAVRAELRARNADALLVPSSDPHLSEYLPGRWQGRVWLSGFTGSMGALAVTRDGGALFVDSRYWEQGDAQTAGSGLEVVKLKTSAGVPYADWLVNRVPRGGTVLVDAAALGLATAQAVRAALAANDVQLRDDDVLASVWHDRPPLPGVPVYAHRPPHAVRSRTANLAVVREAMARAGATHHLVSTLDDVAWITGLRGADVDFNPVFVAHLLLGRDDATLFLADGKVDAALAGELERDGVTCAEYASVRGALARVPAGARLLLDPRRVTLGLRSAVPAHVQVVEAPNPSMLAKSRKTAEEAEHFRAAMVADGAAMCRFYAEFEASLARGERWTECLVDERLSAERAKSPDFVSLSFATCAAFNASGALPHYHPTPESHRTIEGDGLLLIDSGAQYLGGTTDVTRVWPVGAVTPAIRRDVTAALRGLIALSRARFPRGTPSPLLDGIARAPLWELGLDYNHGTGHGVGYFMNVHEGPQSITRVAPDATMAMEPGMVTSIEPGVYRPGRWGVRIENLVLAVPSSAAADEFGEFLEFETLTLCPIDVRCVDLAKLDAVEVAWLDAYHTRVRERLAPHLSGGALAWLHARTEPVGRGS